MRLVTVLLFSFVWAASLTVAVAATPGPSQPAVATTTPVATTPTLEASPSPAPAGFTLSGRLVVDANSSGVEDGGDAPPVLALLNLIPWSTADQILAPTPVVPPDVLLYAAPDGTFTFENLPADSYTLRVHWVFGFETKGASPAVPEILRAAFRVTDKGEIVVPDPLPKYWPGSLEPFVQSEPILGAIPDPILLKKVDNPNIVTVPVSDAGPAGPPPVGHVDVAAALQRQRQQTVQLPGTGATSDSRDSWRIYLVLGLAAGVLFSLAAVLIRRARA